MSMQSQKKNMKTIHGLVSQNLGYIFGERESGPNGAKKQFHTKSAAFLRALGRDLGFRECKVMNNYGGIAVSGEVTLMGMWSEGNGLYVQLSQSSMGWQSFLYRQISHMKDYTGGRNQWFPADMFASGKYAELVDILLALRKPSKEEAEYAA